MAGRQVARRTKGVPQASLDRDQVVTAAMQFVDANGLHALSMRKLAGQLGVEAMALYNYVEGKDDLLRGLADLLWRYVEAGAPQVSDRQRNLLSLGRSLRQVIHTHPRAAPVLLTPDWLPEPLLRVLDSQLRALEVGYPRARALEALRAVIGFAIGFAITELTCFLSLPPAPGGVVDVRRLRRILNALPPGTPESLVTVAMAVCDCDPGTFFETGLALIVNGLEAHVT